MPTILYIYGWRLFFYSNEKNEPIHIHVQKGDFEGKFWLKIEDKVRRKGKLTLVPMIGWKRNMTWPSTGLVWRPTSPNIPTLDSVAGYPMTGLGAQMGRFKHGIGTKYPFRLLTFDGKSPEELKRALENLNLKGLSYKIKQTSNVSGKSVRGVYLVIQDWSIWRPTELAFAMMQLTARWQEPSPFSTAKQSEINLFNKYFNKF